MGSDSLNFSGLDNDLPAGRETARKEEDQSSEAVKPPLSSTPPKRNSPAGPGGHLSAFINDIREDREATQEELDQSYEVVKKLLPFMAKRGIPATPKNYRLFYDYIVFANPEQNKVLNELLEKGVRFHSQVSNGIHAFFYSREVADLQASALKAAMDFINLSDNMTESINTVREQHSQFHEALTNTSQQVADIDSAGELEPHLKSLLSETEQALATTDTFYGKLKEAHGTIATLKEELKTQIDLTKVDELTKLSNRRHLNQEAPRLIHESVENGRPLSAILFDIDLFKKVNDTFGHNNGDKVLAACASIIKNAARSTDLAVRLGGEEFLLLCSSLNLATAAKVAERIRQSIANTEIGILRGRSVKVTVSGGVATLGPGEDISALIERADAALYKAKAGGRNRVCLADEGGADWPTPEAPSPIY